MRWSWQILRVAGIGIQVHITFALLPIWVGITTYAERQLWTDAGLGVGFILVLFAIVVLHELGHALAARRFGIKTRDITLLPIGGVARLERMPEKPREELIVALAGPAVNVCLAILFFGALQLVAQFGSTNLEASRPGLVQEILATLMWVNVALIVFNLLPAFPMDGGRVLRALLATKWSYVTATNIAAGLGQSMAFLFGFAGLASVVFGHFGPISNPFLLFIGLFVWVGASREAGVVRMKSTLGDVPISSIMIQDYRVLSSETLLSDAARHLLGGWQQDFPVFENGQLAGLLTRGALVDGLAQQGENGRIGEAMIRDYPSLDASASAHKAMSELNTSNVPTLLVTQGNELIGMVSRANLAQYLSIRAALGGQPLFAASTETSEPRQAA